MIKIDGLDKSEVDFVEEILYENGVECETLPTDESRQFFEIQIDRDGTWIINILKEAYRE